ncbi:MAG: polyphosphate kinase 1 [Spirochaetaceae bacterium]|jgi:polyphosphate kinase|nr:polyphosphate kinase 1 [Spirochaetaceae bacterium]
MAQIYFDRELSWLDFNARVLEEALRQDLPLLERYKFLTIVSSNFDEFFMVRMAAMKRAIRHKNTAYSLSGSAIEDLYRQAQKKAQAIMEMQYDCLLNDVLPSLAKNGLHLLFMNDWNEFQAEFIRQYFLDEVFPLLTPLRLDIGIPIAGETLYAAFMLRENDTDKNASNIAVVKIPKDRIVMLPSGGDGVVRCFLLEDAIQRFASYLFPGYSVKERILFKVDRDADFPVDEERDEDFIKAMEEVILNREHSRAVRMTHSAGSDFLRDALARHLELLPPELYLVPGPLNLSSLSLLYDIENFGVSGFEKLKNVCVKSIDVFFDDDEKTLWERIDEGDILLHFPYESFSPVLSFFSDAAHDPSVRAIKTTLYRTSGDSPVVRSLKEAALNGKQVTVIVELKARFDEERNINWAKDLEKAGVTVIYGLARLKVHAKTALVVRGERGGLRSYLHLSTGNYNDKTAKMYADLCLFTANTDFVHDAELFFNMITGYSAAAKTRRLVIAPLTLKKRLVELIEREAEQASRGQYAVIKAKMNAIADTDVIEALYRASRAGVKIFLNIRGVCTLIPGLAELSENIKVVSVIDYFLEHSRIIFFENGGNADLYLSSADWMTRNLERRVELMFPVLDARIKLRLSVILDSFFKDNCQAHALGADGVWHRLRPAAGEGCFQVQTFLKEYTENLCGSGNRKAPVFIVRHS